MKETDKKDDLVELMKRGGRHLAFFVVLGCILAIGAALLWFCAPAAEPVWKGLRLSEWLEMYDCSLRFDVRDGRHPKYSDAEIEAALDGFGTRALPFLKLWLVKDPNGTRPGARARWLNVRLTKVGLGRLFLAVDDKNYSGISETGFQYYGERALPLFPWLTNLTRSPDRYTRLCAYEAAFFARPPKERFLPLADQALKDNEAGCEAMAAQWMHQRFPEEAVKWGLKKRFPQFWEEHSSDL